MRNVKGEWLVAYHGVGGGFNSDEVANIVGSIINMGFKNGKRQPHKDCNDAFHYGCKVGEGIYFTPYINIAERFSGITNINDEKYKIVIMTRVNPKARRHCNKCEESKVFKYWVVNGTSDEVRPYRILFKRI